ncbi:MAG TPA: hypothetical protein VMT55_03080 [Candidatus Sulfotelmatobacter sp.]|nr:hypothetical protein [Candidatus Sulfotelmatobacter sp.]
MKRIITFTILAILLAAPLFALTTAELKDTYKQMTADDLTELQNIKLKVIEDSALNTGYMKSPVSVGGAGGLYYFLPNASINDNKPAQADSISSLIGGAGGFMVNLQPNLAVGGLFGGMGGCSGKKVGISYYTYSVNALFEMATLQYKPYIDNSWIVGLDLGLGLAQAGYTTNITDENLNGQDIVRSGSNWAYLFGVDVRRRLMNTFFISGKIGMFSASIDSLKRGDFTDPGKKLTINAPYIELGLGGNF